MAMAVGWAAAWFRPAGMARTMLGGAIMQLLLVIAMVTAPSTANVPGAVSSVLRFSGIFTVLWLVSAALFRAAAKADRKAALAM